MVNYTDFADKVGMQVELDYGYTDGDDLAFHLLETGVISEEMGVAQAARIVAQHIEQA